MASTGLPRTARASRVSTAFGDAPFPGRESARRDSAPITYALRGDWREGSTRAVKIETLTYRDAFLIAGGFVRGTITQA